MLIQRFLFTDNSRITMNSPSPLETLSYRLILIAAAILLHPTNVLASEFVGGAQMQARDLLSGTVGGQAKTVDKSLPKSDDGDQTSNVDPQDQARQLILGETNFGRSNGRAMALEPKMNATPALSTQGNPRTYSDPQESARRMILGEAASGTATPVLRHPVSLIQDRLIMRRRLRI
jgi:hypothetical protein